jgi:hypothetical protein
MTHQTKLRACVRQAFRMAFPLFAAASVSTAGAAELGAIGDAQLRWDNTLTYSTAFRVQDRDPSLLKDPNTDDGDRNFAAGLVSNRLDLLSQLDITQGAYGFDASAAAWYDTVYNQSDDNNSAATFNPASVSNREFPQAVRDLHGQHIELDNAFLHGDTELAGLPFSFRLGRHTLLWGESLFFPENGIAAGQAPIDQTKALANPDSYARDVFMPVAQASGSLQIANGLALEAYYQFEWRNTRVPGAGSYLSTEDYFDAGGERYIVGPGKYLYRTHDAMPPASGQYGVALRWTPGEIDYGLYALRFNAKDPEIFFHSGLVQPPGGVPHVIDPAIVDFAIGKVGTYQLFYPQGIEIYGASASGYVGDSNIAAEVSGRRNMPLVGKTTPGYSTLYPSNVLGAGGVPLYAAGDTLHGQISAVTTFARSTVWDSADLNAELAANELLDVSKNASALSRGTSRGAVSVRATFQPTYFAVAPGLDLTPSIGMGYNVSGHSSVDANEIAGTGDVDLGLAAAYRVVWIANVSFTGFVGKYGRQSLTDRDFLAFSIKRTF